MLHITSTEDGEATWQVLDHRIAMESCTDYHSTLSAYRMRTDGTTVDIPNATALGVVFFGEGEQRPDLSLVREWFPDRFALWDAVAAAYWDVVMPQGRSRLNELGYVAYDYRTGRWSAAEFRESCFGAGESGWSSR